MSASQYAIEIRITPRPGILDPEGETIARALSNLGYEGVSRVRVGRLIRLALRAEDPEAARAEVSRMCEELISNPLIEDYEIRVAEAEEP
ncbi:MAG: phosphoribosylformylglycinamidine synthase subunit PurS [Gemmatimonadota bacterium]